MYIAKIRDDDELYEVAMSSYSTALGHFRSEIAKAYAESKQTKQRQLLMSINMCLLLFEYLANGPNGEGLTGHLNGALSIIKNSDPKLLQTPLTRSIFTTIRCLSFWNGLQDRRGTFLASEPWVTVPYAKSGKNFRELLFDHVLLIPGLLEAADEIKSSHVTWHNDTEDRLSKSLCRLGARHCHECIEFLQSCDSVIRSLENWLDLVHQSEKGPIWWYTNASALQGAKEGSRTPEKTDTRANSSSEGSFIKFSSPGIPGMMEVYWSGLLQLSRTIFQMRNLNTDIRHVACLSVLGPHSPSLSMDESRSSKLALRICQTAIELGQTIEGSSIAYTAVLLADDYFRQLLKSSSPPDETESSHISRHYEVARIGLECSQRALTKLRSKLKYKSGQVADGLRIKYG
ncbi:hypothetical protein F5884DRAFT_755808 [Xylogone sp. PMI_703]|nr:hypothetical protein F5884DRAFT_755808 [Xylogone sp. PMI_703]